MWGNPCSAILRAPVRPGELSSGSIPIHHKIYNAVTMVLTFAADPQTHRLSQIAKHWLVCGKSQNNPFIDDSLALQNICKSCYWDEDCFKAVGVGKRGQWIKCLAYKHVKSRQVWQAPVISEQKIQQWDHWSKLASRASQITEPWFIIRLCLGK